MNIYTKKGDSGKTGLNNLPLYKDDEIMEVLGNLDELNSCMGKLHTLRNKKIRNIVFLVQDELLHIGADLAQGVSEFDYDTRVREMEGSIDELSKVLPSLKNFIIPGGSRHAAQLHICRAVARRLERSVVTIKNTGKKDGSYLGDVLKYMNRLSDLLFVMARYVNFKLGIKEIIWPTKK